MACSPAQLESNRKNAAKSTGPRTVEGKAKSRGNGLKHGLTGAGIVLSTEDAAEVQRRIEALEVDMAPRSELALRLVGRVALLMLKLDRCAQHEARTTSYRMRQATAEFDDARLAAVEKSYSWIAHEPSTNVRRMKMQPEGIALLIGCLGGLKEDLQHPEGVRWTWHHCEHLHHLMGKRPLDVPVSRARGLSEAVMGNPEYLEPTDAPDLKRADRERWAADRLVELIDTEVAKLEALRESLDREGLQLDRLEAPARALFDSSKEGILARKYEAALERGLYRALREFREVQTEVVSDEGDPSDPSDELASGLPADLGEIDEEISLDSTTTAEDVRDLRSGLEGRSGKGNRPDLERIRRQRRR